MYTFRERDLGSTMGLTYVIASLVRRIAWAVSGGYTHSDGQAIYEEIKGKSSSEKRRAVAFEISLNGRTIEQVTQITQWVTAPCDSIRTMKSTHYQNSGKQTVGHINECLIRLVTEELWEICGRIRDKKVLV